MKLSLFLICSVAVLRLHAQEAQSGFELRATLSGLAAASSDLTQTPRSGSPAVVGFRSVFYPVWKISENWTVSGTYQVASRPYFYESFSTQGHGVKGTLLQATLNYSRVSRNRSLLLRVGELSTAFGSFLLRYDDATNPLVDLPMTYGYYYAPVSSLPVAGAQLDVTGGKWDGLLQFANSSPVNPRSVVAQDQYGNWAGGGGYTIRQGFRVGASAYHGPYLYRKFPYYFPGEARPSELPASALGLDVQWARGHWNLQGEVQKFVMPYRAIPVFREQGAYFDVKRVINPRWYLAARAGYLNTSMGSHRQTLESVVGFRLNSSQLLKFSYEFSHATQDAYQTKQTVAVQFVATTRLLSHAWK